MAEVSWEAPSRVAKARRPGGCVSSIAPVVAMLLPLIRHLLTVSLFPIRANAFVQAYSDESLRPVTIKQLLDWEEPFPGSDIVIDGMNLTQVTLVGQVRSVNPQSTNITYRLDDGTGSIDVKRWVDAERPDDSDPKFALDQYVRVWGRLKTFNNKKHLGAHFIRAVDDFNEVSYHLLEATYVHLQLTGAGGQGHPQQQGAAGVNGGTDSMFVDDYGAGGGGAASTNLSHCSRNAQTMYNFLMNAPGGAEGVHLNVVSSGTGLSVRDVIAAADELLSNGLVYTTVDDETWAILETYG
ncbi:hypothetical protein VTK73DRAFT_290 [Phialemonium thermophilum]|uniref:Replication protein A C-terminal domain-containing protein n=1 Tax=Phialemonium thermophilum TaxID=223376 RepID=A0ABR3VVU4_9PEZI